MKSHPATMILTWGLTVAVATLLAIGCSEETNSAPTLLSLHDTEFMVNTPGELDVRAVDDDGDRLSYAVSFEPVPPSGAPGLTRLNNERALLRWTPRVDDAGPAGVTTYRVTFTVTDDAGGQGQETIALRVVGDGTTGSAALRFVEPAGEGMAVASPCVNDLRVVVKGDNVPEGEVEMALGEPVPVGATLTGSGKTRSFSWCPSADDLAASLSYTVTFVARRRGGDEPITKRFLLRFRHQAADDCAGEAPVVSHSPVPSYDGVLNYQVQAQITDDVGFKAPPVLLYAFDPVPPPTVGGLVDTSGWPLVRFEAGDDDRWSAAIPNPGLEAGVEADLYYVVIATDNDDPEGARCDHTTETPAYHVVARGGGGGRTYGFCEACVADAQCGRGGDLCVTLRGEGFCGEACGADNGCSAGRQCVEVESVDGVTATQCLPADLNCGQICIPDVYDTAGVGDEAAEAPVITAGVHRDLSICGEDQDYFWVPVTAGSAITVTARFSNQAGDLDLAMAMPDESDLNYQSLNGDADVEIVSEPCVGRTGEALVVVFPFEDAENSYDLEIETGPGDCDRICNDDSYDDGVGNDILDDFVPIEAEELPFYVENLQICHEDDDYFGFEVFAGEIISVAIDFNHFDGDLDMALYRAETGMVVGDSLSFRDVELIEVEAEAYDIYVVRVFGATRSVANSYALEVGVYAAGGCEQTVECAPGAYCAQSECVDAACAGFFDCGAGHACTPDRAGMDPAAGGGQCLSACRSDLDCRLSDGYVCKRFEDYTRACGDAGEGTAGARCGGYEDCAGEAVCFPGQGGYCAVGGCGGADVCPGGTVCDELFGFAACLKTCGNDGDCRVGEGYTCQATDAGIRACQP